MALAPQRPCGKPGCPALVPAGQSRCDVHRAELHAEDRARRGSSAQRGYGYRWQKYRAAYLRKHPLCVLCKAEGRITPADVVDHVIDHKGDQRLLWDPTNHRGLCKPHHDRRTDAGDFGRKRGRAGPYSPSGTGGEGGSNL